MVAEHHILIDHGDVQDWAERLAACRSAALGPEGTRFYEEWLEPTVTDPDAVARCIEDLRAEHDRYREASYWLWSRAQRVLNGESGAMKELGETLLRFSGPQWAEWNPF